MKVPASLAEDIAASPSGSDESPEMGGSEQLPETSETPRHGEESGQATARQDIEICGGSGRVFQLFQLSLGTTHEQ